MYILNYSASDVPFIRATWAKGEVIGHLFDYEYRQEIWQSSMVFTIDAVDGSTVILDTDKVGKIEIIQLRRADLTR